MRLTLKSTLSGLLFLLATLWGSAVMAQVKIERVEYGGWPNCYRLSNDTVELIVTTDVGPRVIHYGLIGKENEFYVDRAQLGKTNAKEWLAFGGHRLWLSPEAKPRSYYPDSKPVRVVKGNNCVQLIQPTEDNGIQKEMIVTLHFSRSQVTVEHTLTNHNMWDVELAPWTLTVMAPGGKAIFPQEKYSPHPDIPDYPDQVIDKKYYLPVRSLVLWSYTTLGDPRWVFTNKYIILHQDPKAKKPQKIGLSNRRHWGAYLRGGHLFVKQNTYQEGATYPDGGCSFETFTNSDMLELECLGPMTKLPANGGSVTLTEIWWLLDGVKADSTDASIDAEVLPKIQRLSKMFL